MTDRGPIGRLRGSGEPVLPEDFERPPGDDPDNPVPWQPGHATFARSATSRLTLDSSFVTGRDDVLVYTSEPLEQDRSIELFGAAVAHLSVSSTASVAFVAVKLCDV